MEPFETTLRLLIPIDGWGFDRDYIWITLQGVRFKISCPDRPIQMQTPALILEVTERAYPRRPPE